MDVGPEQIKEATRKGFVIGTFAWIPIWVTLGVISGFVVAKSNKRYYFCLYCMR